MINKIINNSAIILFICLIISCDSDTVSNDGPAEVQNKMFNHAGLTRDYLLYLPTGLPENAPLVFVLHGYSGSASLIRNYSAMNALANQHGFAVCYPQGIKDEQNNSFWNVGYDFHQNQTVDDSDFLKSLAIYIQTEYNLSPEYTFATGMSNGGDMCYMLACEQAETFKAVAPVAGSMMQWIYNACPENAVPVFEIHGDNDNITLWEGDLDNSDGYGAYLAVLDTFDFWVQQNECSTNSILELPNTVSSDNSTVSSIKFTDGTNNNEVWLYRVNNGGHYWPGSSGNMDINASAEIWSFFNIYIQNN
jgi:polyhydroxybutyrate depolymerase